MSNSTITQQVQGLATTTSPGLVGTGSQTFAGIKTFQDGLVPDTPMMFRNKIINGGFDIWQRATSSTGTTGYVSADRTLFQLLTLQEAVCAVLTQNYNNRKLYASQIAISNEL